MYLLLAVGFYIQVKIICTIDNGKLRLYIVIYLLYRGGTQEGLTIFVLSFYIKITIACSMELPPPPFFFFFICLFLFLYFYLLISLFTYLFSIKMSSLFHLCFFYLTRSCPYIHTLFIWQKHLTCDCSLLL